MYFSTCGRICLHSPIFCCYVFVLVLGGGAGPSPLVRKIWALSSSQASCEIFFAMVRDLLQSTLYIYIDLSPYPPAGLGSSSKVLLVTSRLWNLHSNVSTPTLQLFPSYPTPVLPFVHPPSQVSLHSTSQLSYLGGPFLAEVPIPCPVDSTTPSDVTVSTVFFLGVGRRDMISDNHLCRYQQPASDGSISFS